MDIVLSAAVVAADADAVPAEDRDVDAEEFEWQDGDDAAAFAVFGVEAKDCADCEPTAEEEPDTQSSACEEGAAVDRKEGVAAPESPRWVAVEACVWCCVVVK
ncbi:hypothetical protein IWW48_004410 [Coemansia sp. RSA 1200]|nr:hypothetical protein IWW48_004410 [Coemansia sp. RSA 1200]